MPAAIRLGPYLPAIDSELGLGADQAGPYEQMFGGSGLMLGFDLDRYFLFPAGQLGVTTSVSWMSKSAHAYQAYNCTEPEAPSPCIPDITVIRDAMGNPVRSEGDTTGFKMLPISLGLVYRLTVLDERLSVPVVPYAKAGLSYAPNAATSHHREPSECLLRPAHRRRLHRAAETPGISIDWRPTTCRSSVRVYVALVAARVMAEVCPAHARAPIREDPRAAQAPDRGGASISFRDDLPSLSCWMPDSQFYDVRSV